MFSDQICFRNEGIHLSKPARAAREGQHSFLCSQEIKVTQPLGGVKKPVSSWCQYWEVLNAFTSHCHRSTVQEQSTTHPSSYRKFILSPLNQKHLRPLIYAASSYFLFSFFPLAKKELVPLLSDRCFLVQGWKAIPLKLLLHSWQAEQPGP